MRVAGASSTSSVVRSEGVKLLNGPVSAMEWIRCTTASSALRVHKAVHIVLKSPQ